MASGFTIRGMDGLTSKLADLARRAAPEVVELLRDDVAPAVKEAIKAALPRDTGAFADSGRVEDVEDGAKVVFNPHYPKQAAGRAGAAARRAAKPALEAVAPALAAKLKVR